MESSADRVKAMDDTRAVVSKYFSDSNAFPFSRSFETWETDKIIQVNFYHQQNTDIFVELEHNFNC